MFVWLGWLPACEHLSVRIFNRLKVRPVSCERGLNERRQTNGFEVNA